MPPPRLAYRDRAALPMLGAAGISGPLLLDTNVFLHALTGRGPPVLQTLLANLPRSFVSAATLAELAWSRGRLDPDHAQTARVLAVIANLLDRIELTKILTPTADQWRLTAPVRTANSRSCCSNISPDAASGILKRSLATTAAP